MSPLPEFRPLTPQSPCPRAPAPSRRRERKPDKSKKIILHSTSPAANVKADNNVPLETAKIVILNGEIPSSASNAMTILKIYSPIENYDSRVAI